MSQKTVRFQHKILESIKCNEWHFKKFSFCLTVDTAFQIVQTNRLVLIREKITVDCEDHTQQIGCWKKKNSLYDIYVNCNWVVTRWQYYTTHLHTNNTQNNKNNRTTQITTNLEECGPCPVFASFTLALALQLRKKHRKPSVRVRKTSGKKNFSQGIV